MMILYTMKYRSRTDIIVTMLEAATSGATKTKIMYSSYLSSHTLRVYLDLVISNGLLAYDSTKQRYSTTEKGFRQKTIRSFTDFAISLSAYSFLLH